MKLLTYKILFPIAAMVLLCISACKKDFLERTPGVSLPEENVFAKTTLATQFADNAYTFLVDDYARFDTHRGSTSQASDEAVSGTSNSSVRLFNQGLYHDVSNVNALNDILDIWKREYEGIRVTNMMLSKMDIVPWTSTDPRNRIEGEMHYLRAFFYFELIKRFGGVPIVDRVYETNEDIDFPRNTYDECLAFIIKDLDLADQLLPASYDGANNGRATLGGAAALRSRVLLYAASKLNNDSGDPVKWRAASNAAAKVMGMSYSLQATYDDILNVAESPEYIMIKIRGPRLATENKIVDFAQSPGSNSISGSMNPTQNHVDLYEAVKKDGTGKIISSAAIGDANSGYNPQAPYDNRDPRLSANVLYNDRAWQGRRLQMWDGGKDYSSTNTIYTATRYYCRKYWPEPYIRGQSGTALLNFVYFRYAEILLNFAEAKNEYEGPVDSVYTAINLIRTRVGMPGLPQGLSKDEMRLRIRNERAVELAFEDHRWYDIMRWKIGPQVVAQPMYGMNVVRNTNGTFTYSRVLLPNAFQKVYLDHMHRYPIPRQEVQKSKGILLQNPGW